MRKNYFFALLFGLLCVGVFAQETDTTKAVAYEIDFDATDDTLARDTNRFRQAVSLHFGSSVGLDFSFLLNKKFTVTGRINTVPFSYSMAKEFGGYDFIVDATADYLAIDAVMEYYPFRKFGLKLVGGISYVPSSTISVKGSLGDNVNYQDFEFTPEEVGYLQVKTNWATLMPYLGLGFGRRVDAKKRVGINFELGSFYAGSPEVDLIATGRVSQTEEEEEQLRENLKDFKWLPYTNISIVYRF